MVAMILITLREKFHKGSAHRTPLIGSRENYNYFSSILAFFLINCITCDRIESAFYQQCPDFSFTGIQLISCMASSNGQKPCPTHDTIVKQRRQMFLGFSFLGLNSCWRLTLIDSLSHVRLGFSGGLACVNLDQQPSWGFKKGDVTFGRKDRWYNTHAILRWLWFPGDEEKIRVFL